MHSLIEPTITVCDAEQVKIPNALYRCKIIDNYLIITSLEKHEGEIIHINHEQLKTLVEDDTICLVAGNTIVITDGAINEKVFASYYGKIFVVGLLVLAVKCLKWITIAILLVSSIISLIKMF